MSNKIGYTFTQIDKYIYSSDITPEEFKNYINNNNDICIENTNLNKNDIKNLLYNMKQALWWNDSIYIKNLYMHINSFSKWGSDSYIVEAINCKAWNVIIECFTQFIKHKIKFNYINYINLMNCEEFGLLILTFIYTDHLYELSYFLTKYLLQSVYKNSLYNFYTVLSKVWELTPELRIYTIIINELLYIKLTIIPEEKRSYIFDNKLVNPFADNYLLHTINKAVANYFKIDYIVYTNYDIFFPDQQKKEKDTLIDFLI